MAVTNPEHMSAAFQEAFNSGNIEALMALYEPEAILVPAPGKRATGQAAIHQALTAFLRLHPTITCKNNYCIRVGPIAMLQGEWTMSFIGDDGKTIQQSSRTAEVVRQQSDGSWRYLIDHPFIHD